MVGGAGVDNFSGGNGNDVIYGRAGSDVQTATATPTRCWVVPGRHLPGGAGTGFVRLGTDALAPAT
jgi:Ca2+-binding RTX toxin-like protein